MLQRDHLGEEEIGAILDGDYPDDTTSYHVSECDTCRRTLMESALFAGLLRGSGERPGAKTDDFKVRSLQSPSSGLARLFQRFAPAPSQVGNHISKKELLELYDSAFSPGRRHEYGLDFILRLFHVRACDSCLATLLDIANQFAPSPLSIAKATAVFDHTRTRRASKLLLTIRGVHDWTLVLLRNTLTSRPNVLASRRSVDESLARPQKSAPSLARDFESDNLDQPAFSRKWMPNEIKFSSTKEPRANYEPTSESRIVGPWRLTIAIEANDALVTLKYVDGDGPVVGARIIVEDSKTTEIGSFVTSSDGTVRVPTPNAKWIRIDSEGAQCIIEIDFQIEPEMDQRDLEELVKKVEQAATRERKIVEAQKRRRQRSEFLGMYNALSPLDRLKYISADAGRPIWFYQKFFPPLDADLLSNAPSELLTNLTAKLSIVDRGPLARVREELERELEKRSNS